MRRSLARLAGMISCHRGAAHYLEPEEILAVTPDSGEARATPEARRRALPS